MSIMLVKRDKEMLKMIGVIKVKWLEIAEI
jgi:hypothetical protein